LHRSRLRLSHNARNQIKSLWQRLRHLHQRQRQHKLRL
jgi:hypothetical protein